MKAHLFDGTYELFRAYFGAPSAIVDGREVGATRGLVRSLAALLRSGAVSHAGIAFDHVIESFRNRLFAGYKTSEGIEPALFSQFGLAEDACRALGLVVWPMIEHEADDALATAAARLVEEPALEQIVIATPDKDLAQCVTGQRVVGWDRAREVVLDEAGVIAKFGVGPASIPDLLALVGDDADGIPGLPRWGAKSAATVLAHYRHIEAIPDRNEAWNVAVRGAAALAQALREHRTEAALYKVLATLRRDADLGDAPADLATLRWRGVDRDRMGVVAPMLGIAAEALRLPAA